MLKIRLKRLGRKKKPFYRIILIDSKKKRNGKAIEEMGFYNPINKKSKLDIVNVKEKITQGAQTTEAVQTIINNYYK
uniref:Small ribosomal subunit protein bS16c n=1 Tax=Polysiphonia sp. TaxID=1967842 RepID=A0A1Z1MUR4_9FLOR|nr:ribosomal protein S16 [Polysiphonia sp.]